MSARSSTTGRARPAGPGAVPRTTAVTEEQSRPRTGARPRPVSVSWTRAWVAGSRRPISGCRWNSCRRATSWAVGSIANTSRGKLTRLGWTVVNRSVIRKTYTPDVLPGTVGHAVLVPGALWHVSPTGDPTGAWTTASGLPPAGLLGRLVVTWPGDPVPSSVV